MVPGKPARVFLASGGVKPGLTYGEKEKYGIDVARDRVHFHATILHLPGMDHTKLTYRHAGRDFRLTGVHGTVIENILA